MDLLIATNPSADSRLPYLLRVPLPAGDLVFRTSGTWPRTKALYCHRVSLEEWPEEPELVEQIPLRSCQRRGAAIDIVCDRAREARSQIVFTTARGRDVVFWQSARTRKQARPRVRTPSARAQGLADLEIVVDTRERYAYDFGRQQATVVRRALRSGDYGLVVDGSLVAAVERKSLADLVGGLTGGTLRYQAAELAGLPRAAIVVEDRYSQLLKVDHVRPAAVLDALAELHLRWPNLPVAFCETRALAEEWTYRYLAAARTWAVTERAVVDLVDPRTPVLTELEGAPAAPDPSVAEVRAWARDAGLPVADRGRVRPEIWQAWRDAQPR